MFELNKLCKLSSKYFSSIMQACKLKMDVVHFRFLYKSLQKEEIHWIGKSDEHKVLEFGM